MGKILDVTMTDVARKVGVSQTAVSLAFRHDASIPTETRERILAMASLMGYRPHAGISSLMAQIRARRPVKFQAVLGAVTNWVDRAAFEGHLTWQLQWKGAKNRAEQLGYVLEEFSITDESMSPRRLASVLRARGIEGVVVFPVNRPQPLNLPWENLAAIAIGYTLEVPLLHRVVTAHFDAVLIALQQLRERGYRHIGLVVDEQMNRRVHRNWIAAFSAFGFEIGKVALDAIVTLPAVDAKRALAQWVHDYKPDAVISGVAHPVRSWLREFGLQAPRDVGIVRLAHLLPDEECACIDEAWERVGSAAVDLLVGQLHRGERGVPRSPTLTLVRGEWLDGNSVRKPPRGAAEMPSLVTPAGELRTRTKAVGAYFAPKK